MYLGGALGAAVAFFYAAFVFFTVRGRSTSHRDFLPFFLWGAIGFPCLGALLGGLCGVG